MQDSSPGAPRGHTCNTPTRATAEELREVRASFLFQTVTRLCWPRAAHGGTKPELGTEAAGDVLALHTLLPGLLHVLFPERSASTY